MPAAPFLDLSIVLIHLGTPLGVGAFAGKARDNKRIAD